MDFLMLLFCFFTILVIFLFIRYIYLADGDLTLLYCEKFGRDIREFGGKVIWITGASSGIGEYLAYDLAVAGAKLALSGVSVEKLEKVRNQCLEKSALKEDDVLMVPFSIENYEVHDEMVAKVIDHFGHIDVLVNNAGMSQRANFEDVDIEVHLKVFSVNVFGAVNLTRKVLKHFLERKKGHFVVNSSTAGKMGAPYSAAYTGSKHALNGYFEGLRTETIKKNISVTIVCPGPVFSGITERCLTGKLGEIANQKEDPTDKKMSTSRCSQLMAVAMANKLDECWISTQPVLFFCYLVQYMPSFYRRVLLKRFFDENKARALRQGRN